MKKQHPITSVGVDYGGTWIRIVFLNSKNKICKKITLPSEPIEKLPKIFKSQFKKLGIHSLLYLNIGAKGIWKKYKRKKLFRSLKGLASSIQIYPDIQVVYDMVLKNKPGIVLIAGTGSIAYGKNSNNQWMRSGGFGPQKGDEGSAYWMSKMWKNNFNLDKLNSVRKSALIAKNILLKAEKKHPLAKKIMDQAHLHLIELLKPILFKLNLGTTVRLGYWGGLFKNNYFLKRFLKTLKKEIPDIQWKIYKSKIDPELYVAQLK